MNLACLGGGPATSSMLTRFFELETASYGRTTRVRSMRLNRSIRLALFFAFTPPGHGTYAHKTREQQPRRGGNGCHVYRTTEKSTGG